jgi:hypothetical protein
MHKLLSAVLQTLRGSRELNREDCQCDARRYSSPPMRTKLDVRDLKNSRFKGLSMAGHPRDRK